MQIHLPPDEINNMMEIRIVVVNLTKLTLTDWDECMRISEIRDVALSSDCSIEVVQYLRNDNVTEHQ
jgi:hypothetical protein